MLYKDSKAMQGSLCFPVSFNIFPLAVPDRLLTHIYTYLKYLKASLPACYIRAQRPCASFHRQRNYKTFPCC